MNPYLRRTDPPRIPRAIADHFVPRLPFVSTLFARLGAVSGTRANVRTLLEQGELIAIWPEGVTGPAKSFKDRYRIQEWRVGFAELALRYHAPVVPVAIVGAEDLNLRRFHFGGVIDGARARRLLGYVPGHPVQWPRAWWRLLVERLADLRSERA